MVTRQLVGVLAILAMSTMVLMAQTVSPFPPPGYPDPFQTSTAVKDATNILLNYGMDRKLRGQAPYGVDGSGNPRWPVGTCPAPRAETTTGSNPRPSSFGKVGVSGNDTPGDFCARLQEKSPKGEVACAKLRSLVEDRVTAIPGNRQGTPVKPWTSVETARMKYAFLADLQKHARFVFDGEDDRALGVALKWQTLGKLHRDQIESVSMNIAGRKNFPTFELWIEAAVQADWRAVRSP